MPRELRLPGESDDAFRARAERAARYARILVDAALANHDIRQLIADPECLETEEHERRNPTVRIDYDEAFAIRCGLRTFSRRAPGTTCGFSQPAPQRWHGNAVSNDPYTSTHSRASLVMDGSEWPRRFTNLLKNVRTGGDSDGA